MQCACKTVHSQISEEFSMELSIAPVFEALFLGTMPQNYVKESVSRSGCTARAFERGVKGQKMAHGNFEYIYIHTYTQENLNEIMRLCVKKHPAVMLI